MAVPKKKTSKSKRNMRRSHDGLSQINNVECPNCGVKKLPHHLCLSCGWYDKKQILNTSKGNGAEVEE